jgi:hypothetical protein
MARSRSGAACEADDAQVKRKNESLENWFFVIIFSSGLKLNSSKNFQIRHTSAGWYPGKYHVHECYKKYYTLHIHHSTKLSLVALLLRA